MSPIQREFSESGGDPAPSAAGAAPPPGVALDIAKSAACAAPQPGRTLADFIEVETLQSLQDRFSALTGVATSFRAPDGLHITRPTGESDFCRLMMSTPVGAERCRCSHEQAARLAGRADAPCRNECHAGLTQFAAPIVVEGRHLATILMGDRPRAPLTEDALRRLSRECGIDGDLLQRAAWALRAWSDRDMTAAVGFLQFMAHALAQRCYQAVQLRDRIDELSALYHLSSMLAGATDLQAVLDTSVRIAAEVLAVKAASIRLIDEETGELKIAAVHNLSPRYLSKGGLSVAGSPIDREALDNGIVYVANQPEDPRTVYPAQARDEGIVSALVAAMTYRGKSIGVMRVYTGAPRAFSPFEHSLLTAMASQMAAAIMHARLRHDALEAERLERQIKLAGDVQRRMIPSEPPRHARLEFGAVYRPSLALSGDFYDFLELPQGNAGVAIADVVGKGVPASLTMASVRAAFRAHARSIYDIDRIMAEVNRHICRDTLISEFVTAFYGVFSADGRRLTYCNAGHEPPLLLRAGGDRIESLEAGGMILGVDPAARYDRGIVHLDPGDVLLMYTDGLVEAANFDFEMFGRERARASLVHHRGLDAANLASQILWDQRRFLGLAGQSDDVTIVTVKVV